MFLVSPLAAKSVADKVVVEIAFAIIVESVCFPANDFPTLVFDVLMPWNGSLARCPASVGS